MTRSRLKRVLIACSLFLLCSYCMAMLILASNSQNQPFAMTLSLCLIPISFMAWVRFVTLLNEWK